MVRSIGHRKRPNEKIEQWMDNEISFLSIPRSEGDTLAEEAPRRSCTLGPVTNEKLRESRKPLVGFSGEVNYLLGVIDLNVTMGEQDRILTVAMEFMMVKCHSPYNIILGRTGMRSLGVVASIIHSMIKFPTANGIATMVTNKYALRECQRTKEAPTQEGRMIRPRI
ncbi:hypothetical protein Tco_0965406 [Tanacetum coccineum]